jgi:hypothetical protein
MLIRITTAISFAMLVGTVSPGFSKDQNARRDQAVAGQPADRFHPLYQSGVFASGRRSGQCWVPARDDSDDYGADTRGLGYWGSCKEKGAVPTK